jgi:hypothetical protein
MMTYAPRTFNPADDTNTKSPRLPSSLKVIWIIWNQGRH